MTKLRTGRRVGVHLYEQTSEHPSNWDPPVGTVFTPELATEIVTAVNAVARIRELHRPVRHGASDGPWCNACNNAADLILNGPKRTTTTWPCPTIRALEDQ